MVSIFLRRVDGICPLLSRYTAYNGNSLSKFRENLAASIFKDHEIQEDFLTPEERTNILPGNHGKELPLYAA